MPASGPAANQLIILITLTFCRESFKITLLAIGGDAYNDNSSFNNNENNKQESTSTVSSCRIHDAYLYKIILLLFIQTQKLHEIVQFSFELKISLY